MGVGRTVSEVDEEPIRENERNVNDLFIEYYLPPAARFLPIAAFFIGNVPPAAHFSQQLEKWAKAHTVVSADFLLRHCEASAHTGCGDPSPTVEQQASSITQ